MEYNTHIGTQILKAPKLDSDLEVNIYYFKMGLKIEKFNRKIQKFRSKILLKTNEMITKDTFTFAVSKRGQEEISIGGKVSMLTNGLGNLHSFYSHKSRKPIIRRRFCASTH